MLRHFNITQGHQTLGVFFVIIISLLGVSGCATQPLGSPSPSLSWEDRQQLLSGVQVWSFKGRLAVKDSENESWSASLRWQQDDDSYDIRLSGAFGQGAARMSGRDGYAVIETSDQSALSAGSAKALMQEQLGWSMPVADLKYWLLGRLGPELTDQHVIDPFGRLESLQQSGWQVRYLDYVVVDGFEVPRKLELENMRLRARLVIDSWQLSQEAVR